jgi:predicted ATPase
MRIESLTLENFKSFRKAELAFPQLTLILGSNASGKSNVRDALRFLHGIGRGYSLAEILGGAYKEGVQVWSGIRGGARELCRFGENRCRLGVRVGSYAYAIEVEVLKKDGTPRVVAESLHVLSEMLFDSHPGGRAARANGKDHLHVNLAPGGAFRKAHIEDFASSRPILPRIAERLIEKGRSDGKATDIQAGVSAVLEAVRGLRFLDLSPDAMRVPSIPGETHLGDRGENLSSVLQGICASEKTAAAVAGWIAELTPMDVAGFDFTSDAAGKILLQLVEADGRKVSANSASDGTLRFLGMLAALIGEDSGNCFFLEEIDNGIHPARLDRLMKLLREPPGPASRRPAVISTTHSPSLLRLLGADGLESAILTYRPEKTPETRSVCLKNVKGIREALSAGDLASLHESSWFEDVLAFTEEGEVEA